MMKTNGLENELRNLKFAHLTESELTAYEDRELDQIDRARAETHLKQCFICERRLELLREENAALSDRATTAEEEEFVERLMERTRLAEKPSAAGDVGIGREVSPKKWLAEHLRWMIADWQVAFQPVRHGDEGKELWRWQSEDGRLLARATMEENADMVVHFSSTEMRLEGAKLRFRLRRFDKELTLRQVSESEVAARVAIPWPYRTGGVADISIDIL